MTLTRQQVKEIAKGAINMFAAEMLVNFPKVAKAVLKDKDWPTFLDEQEDEFEEILLRRFGSSD